jgi:hypothetical protein
MHRATCAYLESGIQCIAAAMNDYDACSRRFLLMVLHTLQSVCPHMHWSVVPVASLAALALPTGFLRF